MAGLLVLLLACGVILARSFFHLNVRTGNYEQDKQLATEAVDRFHSLYNLGEFKTIYNEANPAFQSAGPQSALIAAMNQTKKKYGNYVSGLVVGANTFPGGQVRYVYNSQFLRGPVTEMFTLQSDGTKASLIMFRILPGTEKPSGPNGIP